jgi:hypothetical protein
LVLLGVSRMIRGQTAVVMAETETFTPMKAAANSEASSDARSWVMVGCIGAVFLFVGSVAVLYVEWVRADDPTCMIIVAGDAARENATVTVTRLNGAKQSALHAQFKQGPDNRLRFHVPPGSYSVSVRDEKNDLIPMQRGRAEFDLPPHTQAFIELPATDRSR